jgi:hypothetical protein
MLERLPEDAQTLHAELLALLLAQERERSLPHLAGSFTTKVVKGMEYVYFQYSDPGGAKRQFTVAGATRHSTRSSQTTLSSENTVQPTWRRWRGSPDSCVLPALLSCPTDPRGWFVRLRMPVCSASAAC